MIIHTHEYDANYSPDMPVIEETGLESPVKYERFVSRVFRFREQLRSA
jgi:hypothetical protein